MIPYQLGPGEGDAIWMYDGLDTIKADHGDTDGRFTLVEFADNAESAVPMHVNNHFEPASTS
ncbi:hypothetical protein [Pseudonocardia nigra]|uniref:hypothetical protein n=1 Tax=Pseudonocardia nigra TaxID=1921578 RepID=UPI001C5D5D54|nr:hypothetical protein [Pseudonocardia nigra]